MSYWIAYPAAYQKQIKPLLHQQMWLFGRDILCPQGNLLYDYQFTHTQSPDKGGSMYTCWQETHQITLWGWGIWFGQVDAGAIFVNRYKARPQYTAVSTLSEAVHREKSLPRRTYRVQCVNDAQTMQRLWVELLTWLAEYEAWIQDTAGNSWRQVTLQSFKHAVTEPAAADQLAGQWHALAKQGESLPIRS